MAFTHDVFLSHCKTDRAVVSALAKQLTSDGLRVWLDQWEIRPGDSIPAKIEEGLTGSRVLVLCMSAAAFGSDWARLESQTFQFRDPLNRERRFIPLRLDETEPQGTLAQFLYVDWRGGHEGGGRDTIASYTQLLESCRPPAIVPTFNDEKRDGENDEDDPGDKQQGLHGSEEVVSLGHTDSVTSVAFSPDGRHALSSSADKTIRLWDVESQRAIAVLEGHTLSVTSIAFSPDGRHALSGSADKTIRLWDVESQRAIAVFEGHTLYVTSVAYSPDGRQVLSGSDDSTVRLWDVASRRMLAIFEGHTHSVSSVAFSPDGCQALSGSQDKTIRLWDVASRRMLAVFEGHIGRVTSVVFSPNGRRVLSGSTDVTVRLWDLESMQVIAVFEGHTRSVNSVAYSPNGGEVLSASVHSTFRLWDVASRREWEVFEGHSHSVNSVAFSPDGRQALSGSDDRTVRLWKTQRERVGLWGERTLDDAVFEGHTDDVTNVAFSADRCRAASSSNDKTVRLWDVPSWRVLSVFEGHTDAVTSVAFRSDGRHVLSGSNDRTVRLWDIASRRVIAVFEGHTDTVRPVVFSPDGSHVLSGSDDATVRLWDVASRRTLAVFRDHALYVRGVAFSPDGCHALSASADNTVRLWDVASRRALAVFEGHVGFATSIAFSPDGNHVLSGSSDATVRLWDVASRRALAVFEGHTDTVRTVVFSPNGQYMLSGSDDRTVRWWNVASRRALAVFEGHSGFVRSVAFSTDGRRAFSAAANGVLRSWQLRERTNRTSAVVATTSPASDPLAVGVSEQLQYTNAKVLLVGDSGAGKTGLSMRLAENSWRESDSTVGAWATQWRLGVSPTSGVEREIWLWDFGGQADQRLIHQLFMDQTRLAILVFDPQKDDLFEALGQWDRDLTRAAKAGIAPAKLLVAGRIDAGGLRVALRQVNAFAAERGFTAYLETSAKVGTGCDALRDAIMSAIRWDELPWRSSPRLFKRLKDEILRFKDEGRILMRFKDLRDALALRMPGESFRDEEIEAVLGLLEGPGAVWKLAFGSWVLLQPERVNAYAQAVIQTIRADRRDLGTLAEEQVLRGDLAYQSSLPRLPADDERIVLLAMHQILVERGLCLREHTERGTQLVFPSFYRRERPDVVGHPAVFVSYRFDGFLDDIYATLVVRLHHAASFKHAELWRYAADFETLTGKRLGIKLTRRAEGAGELELYFDPNIAVAEQIIFSKYVHEHLLRSAKEGVARLRHYVCRACKTPVGNREVAMARLAAGKPDIVCAACEARVPLWDELEQWFAKPEMAQQVHQREEMARVALDSESKERALVGEVISTVTLAGQLTRELTVSDHGIDMEIEFTSDAGEPTGQKLYLQLTSTDSHSTRRMLERNQPELFKIDQHHAHHWLDQPFPVMLVVRSSTGEVRWMNVRDYLQRENADNRKAVHQVSFTGERFDVMSVRRWRARALGTTGDAL